jgi:glyoxylase-like metal-dependent hydrolase (beta-lactamase superfamily II)
MRRVGDFELHAVSDGFFRLDGGAMFGIVPKPVWEKVCPPDERNRIRLSLTCLLAKAGGKTVLVDTGLGDKHDARFRDLYAVDRSRTLLDSLGAVGVKPEEVDLVVLSHLHFDHAGGATRRENDGTITPTFPRATYIIQEGMWDEAMDPNPRTKGSYMKEDFEELRRLGRVKFVQGDAEIAPGVRCRHTGGHVKHHQSVEFESRGEKAFFWGDLLPTTHHAKPAWVMSYDLFPHEVASLKEKMVARAAAERWVNVFEHDPDVAMGVFVKDEKGFRVDPLERVKN